MTDNMNTMRGVIADALSNPAGTCAKSCEGNAYQIEIRQLKRHVMELEARLRNLTQGLADNGCEIWTALEDGRERVRNIQAEKAEAQLQAAREQEPVAWMYDWHAPEGLIRNWATSNQAEIPKHAINIRPLYARPVPAEPVNVRLLEALKETAQTLAWNCFGECRGLSDGLLPANKALENARAAIASAEDQQSGPVRLTSDGINECLTQWRSSRHETYENLAWILEAASLRANGFNVQPTEAGG